LNLYKGKEMLRNFFRRLKKDKQKDSEPLQDISEISKRVDQLSEMLDQLCKRQIRIYTLMLQLTGRISDFPEILSEKPTKMRVLIRANELAEAIKHTSTNLEKETEEALKELEGFRLKIPPSTRIKSQK